MTNEIDIVERLRSSAPLPLCPFEKRSPEYWTTPDDKPCKFCGGLPDGTDKCTGADMRIMSEAADEIDRLRSTIPTADSRVTAEMIEAALNACPLNYFTPRGEGNGYVRCGPRSDDVELMLSAALSLLPLAQEGVETAAVGHLRGDVPCPCTLIEQYEDCPIGYPSMVCGICEGKGHTTQEQVTALACEMIKIASDVGEPEDPFAAWESISLIQSQNDQLRKAAEEALQAMKRCEHDGGFDREIGPIGCNLGDKCVCLGIYPIIGRASTLPHIEHKQGGEVEQKRVPERPELQRQLAEAKAKLAAMSPDEQQAMWQAQRESWGRGEMQLDRAAPSSTPERSEP